MNIQINSEVHDSWVSRAIKAEQELAALKKDARICALEVRCESNLSEFEIIEAAYRILEATKEE